MTYINAIGRTKFGNLGKDFPELMYESIYNTFEDSKIRPEEIDAIFVSNYIGEITHNQAHLGAVASSLFPKLNIPVLRVEAACASGGMALFSAINSLNSFKNILVIGIEIMNSIPTKKLIAGIASATDRKLEQDEGLIFPAAGALVTQQFMKKYDVTMDDLALVSLKNHDNANLNEYAHFYSKKITLDLIKTSKIICSPLRLFDCSPISDGAVSLIVSNEKKTNRDIKIRATAAASSHIVLAKDNDLTTFPAVSISAEKAYKQANLLPKDMDMAEIHDGFTVTELIGMEDLMLCKKGESKYYIREGKTELNGEIPVNTDGGLKANGHPIGATGLAQIYEIVTQLRKEAGKRQVDKADVGIAFNFGGLLGTSTVHILSNE